MNEVSNNQKFKAGKFEGYVTGKLEGICDDIDEIKKDIKTLNGRVINIYIKVAGIGAGTSITFTLLILLIREYISK